ncbi:MAG: heavy metal translocating P-type ATPase [Tenericutes bacterium HGW-Tenericutes-6]|jgi:Cu2+-exporting ATPase|nr:MAG: heavy metal translocating P-type ATPase [Tenericutes bacterium HGW-Tenericutes-6]
MQNHHHNQHDEHHHKNHHEHHHKETNDHHDHHDHHQMMVTDFKKRFFFSLILLFPILAISPMIQTFLGYDLRFSGDLILLLFLSTLLFIYGGYPFFKGMIEEMKDKKPSMMSLIGLAIGVAYFYSAYAVLFEVGHDFFWELSSLISIMLLGHWIEMKSVLGASKALEELLKLMPETAHLVLEDGQIKEISIKEIKKDMHLLVKPGEKVPIDGKIIEGKSSVNESMLTGESMPVSKNVGDELIGGSINAEGSLTYQVTRVGDETFLSQVIKLVKDAQATRSKTQRIADIAAKYLFYIALIGGISTFLIWILLERDLGFAMERAVTVIIIACPHALGLATPLVTAVSSSIGAKHGLLIRNRANFEQAHKIDTVVFDKTGTLTKGTFGISKIVSNSISEDELLSLAYAIENASEHPIAQAIVAKAKEKKITLKKAKDIEALPGKGLKGKIDQSIIEIVSPGYLKEAKISFDEKAYSTLAKEGQTVVFVLKDQTLLGYIALSDVIRETSKEAIQTLQNMGIESYMLTGDNQNVAHVVAEKIGIKEVIAEVLPNQKSEKIESLTKEGKRVAMTGDGINDAPALAKAHLGIAIGAGTDVAIETADVILVKSNPMDVVHIIKLSKSTYRKMIQNLIWATGYNVIAMPLAAGVLSSIGILLSPAIGAVLMSLSTVIVAINARLLKI